jgi:hypothetical protein
MNCIISESVRMKTVQVATLDSGCADCLRDLFLQDRCRQFRVVATPDVTLDGVIIVDAAQLRGLPLLRKEQERLIVIVDEIHDDLTQLWDAGVRHVVFRRDPPRLVSGAILGIELRLASSAAA